MMRTILDKTIMFLWVLWPVAVFELGSRDWAYTIAVCNALCIIVLLPRLRNPWRKNKPWTFNIHGKCKLLAEDRTEATTKDCPYRINTISNPLHEYDPYKAVTDPNYRYPINPSRTKVEGVVTNVEELTLGWDDTDEELLDKMKARLSPEGLLSSQPCLHHITEPEQPDLPEGNPDWSDPPVDPIGQHVRPDDLDGLIKKFKDKDLTDD